jgi:hypothetical protein
MKATHGKTITRVAAEVQKRGCMQDRSGANKEELRREAAAGTGGCGSEQSSARKRRWRKGKGLGKKFHAYRMHWLSVHTVHLMAVEPGEQWTDVDSPLVDMWQLMGACIYAWNLGAYYIQEIFVQRTGLFFLNRLGNQTLNQIQRSKETDLPPARAICRQ